MGLKKIAIEFIKVFAITLLVCVGVTFLWGLVFHGIGIVDWETSFRFATLFGIIIPIIDSRKRMKSQK
jgi:hypothetical protein